MVDFPQGSLLDLFNHRLAQVSIIICWCTVMLSFCMFLWPFPEWSLGHFPHSVELQWTKSLLSNSFHNHIITIQGTGKQYYELMVLSVNKEEGGGGGGGREGGGGGSSWQKRSMFWSWSTKTNQKKKHWKQSRPKDSSKNLFVDPAGDSFLWETLLSPLQGREIEATHPLSYLLFMDPSWMAPGKNHVNTTSTEIFKYVRIHPNFASRPVWCEKMFLCCFFTRTTENRLDKQAQKSTPSLCAPEWCWKNLSSFLPCSTGFLISRGSKFSIFQEENIFKYTVSIFAYREMYILQQCWGRQVMSKVVNDP